MATDSASGRMLTPEHWAPWLAMGLGWLLAKLPYPMQMAFGRTLGRLAWRVLPERRHITTTNLRIAFPDWEENRIRQTARACFASTGQGVVETFMCWWSSDRHVRPLLHFHGMEHLRAAAVGGRGIILLSAHFAPLELGVRACAMVHPVTAMYRPLKSPVINHVMHRRREMKVQQALIHKNDVRGLVRHLRQGGTAWYAPDQSNSSGPSELLPFFGQLAATSLATARIAKMSGALVLPFFTLRLPDNQGYRLQIEPALENFPSADPRADGERVNRLFERVIATAPEQYFWLHRCFKLPKSQPDPYLVTPP